MMTATLVAPPWAPAYHEINLTVSRGDLETLASLALAWDLPLPPQLPPLSPLIAPSPSVGD